MNDLHRSLTDQAEALPLRPGDPVGVARRGARRRTRRRIGGVAAATAAAVLAVTVAVRAPGDSTTVEGTDFAAQVEATPLTWHLAQPTTGLGYERTSVDHGGAVYALSTAPGPADARRPAEPALYRSADGVEWELVGLADGFRPVSLASGGDVLYASGTVPAGGRADAAVAKVGKGDPIALPLPAPLAAVADAHPDEVAIGTPKVAALDAERVAAAVTVTVTPDVRALLPEVVELGLRWRPVPGGVEVAARDAAPDERRAAGILRCEADAEAEADCGEAPWVDEVGVPEAGDAGRSDVEVPEHLLGFHAWEDLGVAPELAEATGTHVLVYASEDGTTFTPVEVPGTENAHGAHILAVDGTFSLVLQDDDRAAVLTSQDGATWQPAGTVAGWAEQVGVLDGHLAVVTWEPGAGQVVRLLLADGSTVPVDLLAGAPDGHEVVQVALGPLGLAALTRDPGAEQQMGALVFTPDGRSISSISVDEHLAGSDLHLPGMLSVTADGVFLRANAVDGDPSSVAQQTVLVGTP